jgi:chemosensory pili system protein ChpC
MTMPESSLTEEELAELKVRSFALPLNEMTLLLPSTVIAEVLDFREVEPAGHMPEWLLGMLSWRGRNVPLFSFEKLLGRETAGRKEESRFVVCNTLNGSTRIPFFAIRITGLPHLLLLTNDMLVADVAAVTEPVVLATFRLQGEQVLVPNLDVMEKMLEHLGITTD